MISFSGGLIAAVALVRPPHPLRPPSSASISECVCVTSAVKYFWMVTQSNWEEEEEEEEEGEGERRRI